LVATSEKSVGNKIFFIFNTIKVNKQLETPIKIRH